MDDVVKQLESAAISGKGANITNFESLYKNNGRLGNQDERRRDILETQKGNRNTKLDRFRGILNLVEAIEEDTFRTPKNYFKPTIYVSGFTKIPNYCDVLMMSEWMYEKPIDFEENWLAVPCPKATRMLVIANKGITKCFNKYGNYRFECRTALPGGNPCQTKKNKHTVVLDCFYQEEADTMHVLDILAWNDCVMTEGEAGFRHFWMSGQLEQIPELKIITKKNKLIFKVIPKFPCTKESLNELLSIFPFYNHNMPPVDGLLFYHQKAQYFSGETPLVGWLYPYMVNEVLGADINVHKGYMLEKPLYYIDYMNFIETFENKNCRKKQRKIFGPKYMDTEMAVSEEDTNPSTSEDTNGNAKEENVTVEQKTMETDHSAQGDNAASGSKKGNSEKKPGLTKKEGKGDGALPKAKKEGKSKTKKMEADTNAAISIDADTNVENSMESDTNVGHSMEANTKAENSTEANTNVGNCIDADTNAGNSMEADTNAGNGMEANTNAGNSMEANTNTANSTETNTKAGNSMESDTNAGNSMESMVADIVTEEEK